MLLGELLIEEQIVEPADIERALSRQKRVGGTLGENLIALGKLTPEQLEAVFRRRPSAPADIEATGLSVNFLLSLMLKCIYVYGLQTPTQIADELKLRMSIIGDLIDVAKQRAFMEALPHATSTAPGDLRYTLSTAGKERALEELDLSYYVGPAPVTLSAYCRQIARQRITHERVNRDRLVRALSHLVLDEDLIIHLGPAINSGQVVLLYGPSGNGKTAVAKALATAFENDIYVPYALELDGQVVKVYDPAVHQMVPSDAAGLGSTRSIRRDQIDGRWVQCRRPVLATGGELTLSMLELTYNNDLRFYEAPVQLRATGGILIIDDFGHQSVRPAEILNRWLVPMERRVDYLSLRTGKTYEFPVDQLTIFSTNISPSRLMDPAMIRRFPFKVAIGPPSPEAYDRIFERVCTHRGVPLPDGLLAKLKKEFYERENRPMAAFHPDFIVNYVIARCRFEGRLPTLESQIVMDALTHLFIKP